MINIRDLYFQDTTDFRETVTNNTTMLFQDERTKMDRTTSDSVFIQNRVNHVVQVVQAHCMWKRRNLQFGDICDMRHNYDYHDTSVW